MSMHNGVAHPPERKETRQGKDEGRRGVSGNPARGKPEGPRQHFAFPEISREPDAQSAEPSEVFGAPFTIHHSDNSRVSLSLSTESWSGAKSEEKSRKPAKLPGICQVYRAFSGMPYARKLPRYLPVGLCALFSNIFENIEGPAHFHIREYSREHRCPGRLFPQEYTSFPQPLTLLDLESLPAIAATRRT